MKPNALWIVVLGLVFAFAHPARGQEAKIEQGRKVFEAQKCSLCHSIEGKGNKKGPLDGVGAKLTADEIRQWIVDPKTMTTKAKATRTPVMKPFPSLSKPDLDALVEYMLSLKAK